MRTLGSVLRLYQKLGYGESSSLVFFSSITSDSPKNLSEAREVLLPSMKAFLPSNYILER
jgi:hypothetical protein